MIASTTPDGSLTMDGMCIPSIRPFVFLGHGRARAPAWTLFEETRMKFPPLEPVSAPHLSKLGSRRSDGPRGKPTKCDDVSAVPPEVQAR